MFTKGTDVFTVQSILFDLRGKQLVRKEIK